MADISIVIPAYNEEDNIADLVKKIESCVAISHELVLVNDHSTDRTPELLAQLSQNFANVKFVENTGAPGFGNALKAGFNQAAAELVVPVMADMCDDLSTIKKMCGKINEGYDIICGSRYMKGGSRIGGSGVKAFLSFLAGESMHLLLGLPTRDMPNSFKMYRKKVIESIDIKSKGFEISMEIPLKAHYLGFKMTEVPTVWTERTRGRSSFKICKLLPDYLRLYIWAAVKTFFG